MYRAILTALKPAASQHFLVQYATTLAAEHQWEVIGLSAIDLSRLAPPEAVPLGGGSFKHSRDEQRIAEARQQAPQVCRALEAACRDRAVSCTIQQREGDVVQMIAEQVRGVDLLLCGHTAGGDASEKSLLYSILKVNLRPAIVVPQAEHSGNSILLAYDGSVQAARTLASLAASGLGRNRIVHVLSLHEDLEQAQTLSAGAAVFLRRHGESVQTIAAQPTKSIANHIIEEAQRVNASLIAMGAFGKSTMREFFFGSVTRSLLETLPLPLFLDH